MAFEWLGLCSSSAGDMGSIPGRGTRIPHAGRCGQKLKIQSKLGVSTFFRKESDSKYLRLNKPFSLCCYPLNLLLPIEGSLRQYRSTQAVCVLVKLFYLAVAQFGLQASIW